MFNSIGWPEIMLLLVVALFIFGPDRLPTMAKEAAGALQKVRGFVTGARTQLRDELGDEFADIDLRSLNPREFVKRQLLDDDPPPLLKRTNGTRPARTAKLDTTKPRPVLDAASSDSDAPAARATPAASMDTDKSDTDRPDTDKPVSARMAEPPPAAAEPTRSAEAMTAYDDVT